MTERQLTDAATGQWQRLACHLNLSGRLTLLPAPQNLVIMALAMTIDAAQPTVSQGKLIVLSEWRVMVELN